MHSYCTIDDLKDMMTEREMIQCSDDEGLLRLHEKALGRISAAIQGATSIIDSYARQGGYGIPLVDQVLARDWSKTIAVAKLQMRRGILKEVLKDEYERVMKALEKLALGTVAAEKQTGAGEAQRDDREAKFSDENLGNF